jgi:hypothetical protein
MNNGNQNPMQLINAHKKKTGGEWENKDLQLILVGTAFK